MKYVEFYKIQNDGSQKIIATCRLNEDGNVECEGDPIFAANLMKDGIKDYSIPEKLPLFFKDGLKFLEQLKFNFTSGYLNASEVMEK
ncbi:MAG: hypothetical protein Q7K28_00175 [Candidatus Wildermuthbacteria bacterium]|nr:hypothetical protein [Candidatus Wildermuthbacteria bacterium]